LGQFEFQKHCYCNAVTSITDLIYAFFGPYAAMFVIQICPGKSLKTSSVSPGNSGIWSLQVLETSFLLSVRTLNDLYGSWSK